jgi:hypothetical protein
MITAKNSILLGYKRKALQRGLEWAISDQRFFELTQMPCYYCSSVPATTRRSKTQNGPFVYNGVDRKENERGYINGNVVPCCKICQRAKMDMPFKEFVTWLMRIGVVFSDPEDFRMGRRRKKWRACS